MIFDKIATCLFALLFVAAGANHFINMDFYVSIMPPYLPAHVELVMLSGVFEVLGGVGLMLPQSRRIAAIGVILLMIAVFPANVYMAMTPEQFPQFSVLALYLRLPLQFVLMAWAWWIFKQTRIK